MQSLVRDDFAALDLTPYGVEINIDDLSKEEIITFIENENFNSLNYLKQDYFNFKKYINSENHILLMLKEGCTIDKAAEMLKADTTDELKAIVYDEHRKGFYVKKRSVSLHDLRLMAECVYASKFINQAHANIHSFRNGNRS